MTLSNSSRLCSWRAAAAAPVLVGALALAGCTSSGSGGPTDSPTTSSQAPTTTRSSQSSSPGKKSVSPLVYRNVKLKTKQVQRLETVVQRAPGVASTNYQENALQVYLSKSVTSKELVVIKRVVQQQLKAAKKGN